MIILIDVDDVILDLLPAWLDMYNRDYNDHLRPEDIKVWDMIPYVKTECGAKIYDYLDDPNLYDFVNFIDGAVEGVDSLFAAGHTLVFVTAKDHPVKRVYLHAIGWLDEGNYVVASNKSLIRGDVIIDDKTQTVQHFPGYGILFDRGHNRGDLLVGDNKQVAVGWADVLRLIDSIQQNGAGNGVVVPGVGVDAPTVVNDNGGKQSATPYRFDLIDPLPLFNMANVVAEGAIKYGKWNWRRISIEDNLNHAITHIYAFLSGDKQDNHLGHAFTRIMFALSLHLTPGVSPRMKPE